MTTLLDVAIGLTLIFFLASMLSSGVLEIISRLRSARGRLMREGLNRLVTDRWIYLRLINHPMVSGLYRDRPGRGSPPSYMPARNFSVALADTLMLRHRLFGAADAPLTLATLTEAIRHAKQKDLGIGYALLPLVEAAPDLDTAMKNIENWFDTAMDRVTGWYKAYAQKMLFGIGLAVAVAFNIDALQVATALSRSAELRAAAVSQATRLSAGESGLPADIDVRAELKTLAGSGLPIGYACMYEQPDPVGGARAKVAWYRSCLMATTDFQGSRMPLKLAGWLITALATALGAPFWFDAVRKLVNLRNAGPVPSKS